MKKRCFYVIRKILFWNLCEAAKITIDKFFYQDMYNTVKDLNA